jgi:hypothetical protein
MRHQVTRFLGLSKIHRNFIIWSPDYARTYQVDVNRTCDTAPMKIPLLSIIDSLRAHEPRFEKAEHGGDAMKQLRTNSLTRMARPSWLFHHTRKPGRGHPIPPLHSDDWFRQLDLAPFDRFIWLQRSRKPSARGLSFTRRAKLMCSGSWRATI